MGEEPILREVDLFRGLSGREIEEIEAIVETREHEEGTVLFEEGARGDRLYIIKDGKVRIDLKLKADADCATVHRLRKGQVLGELSLVDNRRRSATATCETDSEILSIDCARLLELFERNRSIGYTVIMNLARIVATRLRKTNLQLVATVCWSE
jgi:CRP/FNR family cyclic AMP-dependent transcriptional regulator